MGTADGGRDDRNCRGESQRNIGFARKPTVEVDSIWPVVRGAGPQSPRAHQPVPDEAHGDSRQALLSGYGRQGMSRGQSPMSCAAKKSLRRSAAWMPPIQSALDRRMKNRLDGTANKSQARRQPRSSGSPWPQRAPPAEAHGLPLYTVPRWGLGHSCPIPMMNIIKGGVHAPTTTSRSS